MDLPVGSWDAVKLAYSVSAGKWLASGSSDAQRDLE